MSKDGAHDYVVRTVRLRFLSMRLLRAHARLSKWGEIRWVKPISLSVTNGYLHNGVIEAMNKKE